MLKTVLFLIHFITEPRNILTMRLFIRRKPRRTSKFHIYYTLYTTLSIIWDWIFISFFGYRTKKRKRKDTGYSTASSQNLYSTKGDPDKGARHKDKKAKKSKRDRSKSPCSSDVVEARKSKHSKKSDKSEKKYELLTLYFCGICLFINFYFFKEI